MKHLNYLVRLIKHIFTARHTRGFGVHSPAIFDFVRFVIYEKSSFYFFEDIEKLRRELKRSKTQLQITDFGTGSNREVEVREIARKSLSSTKYAQLLYRMVRNAKPQVIVELGTSLGISTSYMASACKAAQCYTFEGCPQIAAVAQDNFSKLGISNIKLIEGNIDYTLSAFLETTPKVDFVFIDANHKSDSLLNYFNLFIPQIHDKSIVVIDDINWSNNMSQAWEHLKRHSRVQNSIDLFGMGILFFDPNVNKKHYKLIY